MTSHLDSSALTMEVQRRELAARAAQEVTRTTSSRGWKFVFAAWAMPIIPFLGYVLMAGLAVVGFVHGIMVWSKGNASGGIKLMLTAWFGTAGIAVVWVLIYAFVAAGIAATAH